MLETINQTLFAMLNAPETTGEPMIMAATIAAEWLLYLVALLMVLGWVRGASPLRRALFNAGIAALIGLALGQITRSFVFVPRPFAAGFGQQFLAHAPDASFPSDHGIILFSVAVSLLLSKSRYGPAALVLALATAWARVFLGVHWPLDMFGAFAVALIAAPLANTLLHRPVTALFALAQKAYFWALDRLHLPPALFPR
jgi:undecaprenyl-diphosphatase